MIYIDYPIFKKKNGRKKYSHLISSESIEELHDFAKLIDVKPHFFHKGNHYDIAEEYVENAIANGAIQVTSRQIVSILKTMR